MDQALFDILCCPVTRQPLRVARPDELARANVTAPVRLEEGLASVDGARVYPVRHGIPLLLADEGITIA